MVYSGIFSSESSGYPIPSVYTRLTGEPAVSTGLSRAFSYTIRGKFDKARQMNKYSIRLAAFFFIQFIARITISAFVYFEKVNQKILYWDVFISLIFFLLAFYPFIAEWFRIFWLLIHS